MSVEQSFVRTANVLAMRKFVRSVANVMKIVTAVVKNKLVSKFSF